MKQLTCTNVHIVWAHVVVCMAARAVRDQYSARVISLPGEQKVERDRVTCLSVVMVCAQRKLYTCAVKGR